MGTKCGKKRSSSNRINYGTLAVIAVSISYHPKLTFLEQSETSQEIRPAHLSFRVQSPSLDSRCSHAAPKLAARTSSSQPTPPPAGDEHGIRGPPRSARGAPTATAALYRCSVGAGWRSTGPRWPGGPPLSVLGICHRWIENGPRSILSRTNNLTMASCTPAQWTGLMFRPAAVS